MIIIPSSATAVWIIAAVDAAAIAVDVVVVLPPPPDAHLPTDVHPPPPHHIDLVLGERPCVLLHGDRRCLVEHE